MDRTIVETFISWSVNGGNGNEMNVLLWETVAVEKVEWNEPVEQEIELRFFEILIAYSEWGGRFVTVSFFKMHC